MGMIWSEFKNESNKGDWMILELSFMSVSVLLLRMSFILGCYISF